MGLKREAHTTTIKVKKARLLNVIMRSYSFNKYSIIVGIIIVNTELPAVTIPLTRPR